MKRFTIVPALVILATLPATAGARDFAPVDRPGPLLSPSADALAASVRCDPGAATSKQAPVLLTSGTTVTEEQNFGFNYIPALRQEGFPVCLVDAPGTAASNNEDIQVRAEYVVHAIRTAYAAGGKRPISIIGHSQGGQVMRWGLRFWPDTRSMVSDVVGLASTNHGSAAINGLCTPSCSPALWQQLDTSDYVKALNSGQETFQGISYTSVYTRTDQFVQPNLDDTGTTSLHTGDGRRTNVATQDVCPGNTSEHLQVGTSDPVSWALALDAITHDGSADEKRIGQAVCSEAFMPGVVAADFPANIAAASAVVAGAFATAPRVAAEPPLKCYVTASCPKTVSTITAPSGTRCVSRRSFTIHLRRGLRGVRVRVDGRHVTVRHRGGRSTAKVDLVGKPRTTVTVRIAARTSSGRAVRQVRRYRTCAPRRS